MAKILVVEENTELAEMLLASMNHFGHEVVIASNAPEVYSHLNRGSINMVLINLNQRNIDSKALVIELRANHPYHHVPVLLISAWRDVDKQLKPIEGCSYLPAHFSLTDLKIKLEEML